MTTIALWHLGVTGALAVVLGLLMLLQALADRVRRRRPRSARRTVITVVPRQRGHSRRLPGDRTSPAR